MARAASQSVQTTIPLDPNSDLRAELVAALDVLEPQIRGLTDLSYIPGSPELETFVAAQLAAHRRRRDLINAVIGGLDSVIIERTELETDGYPTTSTVAIPINVFRELTNQVDDLEKAASVFEAEPAPTVSVALGSPTDKPEGT
jgi:hypothetical protein